MAQRIRIRLKAFDHVVLDLGDGAYAALAHLRAEAAEAQALRARVAGLEAEHKQAARAAHALHEAGMAQPEVDRMVSAEAATGSHQLIRGIPGANKGHSLSG